MNTRIGSEIIMALTVALIVIAPHPVLADTATIDFNCETGRLDFNAQGPGVLVAFGGRAFFSGANVTLLSDGTGGVETSGGIVTIHMTGFTPADVVDSGLSIRITDGGTVVRLMVIDIEDDGFPDVLLTDGVNVNGAEFFAPNSGTNFMTLQYNPSTDVATATIQGFMGNTATISDVNMGPVQMGVQAANNQANFDNVTFTGTDVPLFPPLFDPMNVWVDFSETCGNGAQSYPFGLLAAAVAAADPGATISIVPGTNSSETFSGGSALDTAMTLANSDPGSGSVSIGVAARRNLNSSQSKTGFVSRNP